MSRADQRFEFLSTLAAPEVEKGHDGAGNRVIAGGPSQTTRMTKCRAVTVGVLRLLAWSFASVTVRGRRDRVRRWHVTRRARPRLVERSRVSMGSEVHLTAWTADEAAAVAAFERVFDEFDRLDALMSVWKEGSDVLRLNAAAGKTAVPVSPEVREVLRAAQEVSEWTGGQVRRDVRRAVRPLEVRSRPGRPASRIAHEIARRLPLIDYRALEIDERAGTAFLARAGHARAPRRHRQGLRGRSRASTILRGAGSRDFMIQAGGDLYVAGRRGDRPWRVGIRDPRGRRTRSFAASI